MAPATKETLVPAENGRNVVVREDGDNVIIQWTCGNQNVFTKEGLREALKNFESVNLVPDLFFSDQADVRGEPFYARLVEKKFQADNTVFERVTGGVPWDKFRAAIVKHSSAPKARAKPAAKKAVKPTAKKPAKPRVSRAKKKPTD